VIRLAGCALLVFLLAVSEGRASTVSAGTAAVATPSPLATRIALDVLRQGGTASDAAVAASLGLAVSRPDLTILGSGGFLLYFEKESGTVWCLDFREISARGASRQLSERLTTPEGDVLSIGVPGTLTGLGALHEKFGRLRWNAVVDRAGALAAEGVAADAALVMAIGASRDRLLAGDPTTPLLRDAKAPAIGEIIVQKELAALLRHTGERGARDFYDGSLSKRWTRELERRGGIIRYGDAKRYEAVWRSPLRIDAGDQQIFLPPPPSFAGVAIAGAITILQRQEESLSAPSHIRIVEAMRRVAELRENIGDPDRVRVALAELLAAERLASPPERGDDGDATASSRLDQIAAEVIPEGGAGLTVTDSGGNIAAISFSADVPFGSGVMIDGIFFNSALRQFSTRENKTGLNGIDGGKRPRSAAAPAIILRDGRPLLALAGSSGPSAASSFIQIWYAASSATETNGVGQAFQPVSSAVADSGNVALETSADPGGTLRSLQMTIVRRAFDQVRYHHSGKPDEVLIEISPAGEALAGDLAALGHPVRLVPRLASVLGIVFDGDRVVAIADHRSGGAAGGY
jgi:gamma-glutamyltranspeptidase / glutathione hydrolase